MCQFIHCYTNDRLRMAVIWPKHEVNRIARRTSTNINKAVLTYHLLLQTAQLYA